MSECEKYQIGEAADGWRLDKALMTFKPDTGLRYRRRLCDEGRVLVDGKPRKPGYKVRAGQDVSISLASGNGSYKDLGLRVVKSGPSFAAVSKPGGVHSAVVSGKGAQSVEAVLPDMFEGAKPILLNRLDLLTSGILLVALDEEAAATYHSLEDAGDIRKFYLAEVCGRMDGMTTIKAKLDTDDRKTSKVLAEDDPDERRWTTVEALSHDHDKDTSLVRCLIMKGARHQIRAHLASIGHPIMGDPLYGGGDDGDELRLHHERVEMTGFSAEVGVEWEND